MTERDPRVIVGIRLDTNGDTGVISQVYGDGGLRTVYRELRDGGRTASGNTSERQVEATKLAENSGLPLVVVPHDVSEVSTTSSSGA